jgi:signal transduction histidine kinase
MTDRDRASFESLVNQIAHDVRNHMFTMGLQAELGERRCSGQPEIKAHFDAILNQVDALRRYLDALLLFSRPVKLALMKMDPAAFVREQVQSFQSGQGSGAEISVLIEPEGLSRTATWDGGALGHGVRALLDNAVRSATPAPKTVVSVRSDRDAVSIEVRDSGPGIAPDVLERVAVPMAVRRPGAIGLGLAIARKMAEAHGGRLEIESTGQGTTARLVIPWEVPPPAA